MIEADYLVVGAGTTGMAFTDTMLTETDATVALVDRQGRPGGHWNHAYRHVRLHQPSAFYGVNSRPLGTDRVDTHGGNEGLFELASGAEVLAYFDEVMDREFAASGRVQHLPLCEFDGNGSVTSLTSGEQREVRVGKVVDATHMQVTVPSTRPPLYEVADGATVVTPNVLSSLDRRPDRFVVIGAGKTGIDACLFLMSTGVVPAAITWIMPRDSWLLDRATIQPGAEFFGSAVGGFSHLVESCAEATSVDDLFERLEATGQLLRIDPSVRPTMYKCATVSRAELEELRRIEDVVRLGRVASVGVDEIALADGTIPTTAGTLHVDCTADGLGHPPIVDVFAGARITLQQVRSCQPAFSAAFIGHVEAAYDDDAVRNELCRVVPYPDTDLDFLPVTAGNFESLARWQADPELTAWMNGARLDAYTSDRGAGPHADASAILGRILTHMPTAITNLRSLAAGA